MLRFLFLVLSILTVPTLLGCGDSSGLVKVSGTVSVDGKLSDKGGITFIPVDGQSPTAGAEIIDGTYTSMVPLGESKVQIRIPKVVGTRKLYNTPDSPEQEILEEVLPPKYNNQTELILVVEGGSMQKDWDLPSE